MKKAHVRDLNELYLTRPDLKGRVSVQKGDANDIVSAYCRSHNPESDRAVLFLDPYGNQVLWTTLELVGRTKGIDVWYLFPSFMGFARQMSDDGTVQKDSEKSMTLATGDKSWYDAITRPTPKQEDMFDDATHLLEKVPRAAEVMTRHMISRMKTIFPGVVLDEWLPLGKRGGLWYSLIFGCTNDSSKAKELARRVAKDIMKRK